MTPSEAIIAVCVFVSFVFMAVAGNYAINSRSESERARDALRRIKKSLNEDSKD